MTLRLEHSKRHDARHKRLSDPADVTRGRQGVDNFRKKLGKQAWNKVERKELLGVIWLILGL